MKNSRKRKTANKQRPRKSAKANAAKGKRALKKRAAKTKAIIRKTAAAKTTAAQKRASSNARSVNVAGRVKRRPDYSDVEAGDLQGLSRAEQADSESVDELVEEGNALEAGVVAGVEHADDAEGQEVHTHEVPEDDVPEEYLDTEE
jgi:hypothetical protein